MLNIASLVLYMRRLWSRVDFNSSRLVLSGLDFFVLTQKGDIVIKTHGKMGTSVEFSKADLERENSMENKISTFKPFY